MDYRIGLSLFTVAVVFGLFGYVVGLWVNEPAPAMISKRPQDDRKAERALLAQVSKLRRALRCYVPTPDGTPKGTTPAQCTLLERHREVQVVARVTGRSTMQPASLVDVLPGLTAPTHTIGGTVDVAGMVDEHMKTAALLFGVPSSEVTREQRTIGKRANLFYQYRSNHERHQHQKLDPRA